MFWTDSELIHELTSSQCNWKGNRKAKGTDETPSLYKEMRDFEATSPNVQCV